MSEEFKVEIVNPEKSFLSKEDVIEVVNLFVGGIKNMVCFDKESINKLDHLYRINLINKKK